MSGLSRNDSSRLVDDRAAQSAQGGPKSRRSRCIVIPSVLAGLAVVPHAHAEAVEEEANVTARAVVEWLSPAGIEWVTGGMRTSDFRSIPHSCTTTTGNDGLCTVSDGHSSTPKNIGNILCLPPNITRVAFEPSCTALLTDGEFAGCQRNAFHNGGPKLCNTSTDTRNPIMLACNFRTEKTGEVEWRWTLDLRDDVYVIGCSQRGYRGFSPGPDPSESEPIATGCLRHGRLVALAVGDTPLRPCRPHETEIVIPAEAHF